MLSPSQVPDPDDDALADAQAELLADEWIERAMHDPRMRRAALRAVGLIKSPAEMTLAELAEEHGCSVSTITFIARGAVAKLRKQLLIKNQ